MGATLSVESTGLDGVVVLVPPRHDDERGWFMEAYNRRRFEDAVGSRVDFVQDNVSSSRAGVLRGLHYQLPPTPQGKLVRASVGEVFDAVVDVRRSSPTFGRWFGTVLGAENRRQLWIPSGYAHGFLALTDTAEISYKTTSPYDPDAERTVRWDDPAIGIDWPLSDTVPVVSPRDAAAPSLADAEVFA